jgi:SAM-dependent methyltransferase
MSSIRRRVAALSLAVLLSAMMAAGGATANPPPAPGRALMITVFCRPGWIVDFYPDGRAHVQWGSLPGDGAAVPEGTVGFDALLTASERLRVETKTDGGAQVAVLRERESTTTAFYVSDDTMFRQVLASLRDKWTQDVGGTRFHELLALHPICPDDKSCLWGERTAANGRDDNGLCPAYALMTRSVLIYLADKQAGVRELYRVLKPKGRASILEPINEVSEQVRNQVIASGFYDQLQPEWGEIRKYYDAHTKDWWGTLVGWDERELIRWFEAAGFSSIKVSYELMAGVRAQQARLDTEKPRERP